MTWVKIYRILDKSQKHQLLKVLDARYNMSEFLLWHHFMFEVSALMIIYMISKVNDTAK